MNNKKGFSIVEIIITVSIIILLTVIGISSKKGYDENVSNTKVVADTKTINNALQSYIQENATLPMPGGNTNFYKVDTSYAHSYEDAETFGVYGSLTEETLPKQYLDVLPLDPRTNSYYSYGKTKATNEFEVASIQVIDGAVISKVIGNYTAEKGPYNLIREYNGPSFVYNGSEKNFPYNPDELVLIATDKAGKVYREGDSITTGLGEQKEIFFSDGSVSILEENSKITLNKLNFKGTDNLNTIVKLGLEAGKIWTKATKLNENSQFEVYTTDSTAAVRGTIFGVVKDTNTQTILVEGKIEVTKNETATSTDTLETISVAKGEPVKIVETSNNNVLSGITQSTTEIVPVFSKNEEIRSDGTSKNIKNICNSFILPGEGGCLDNIADTQLTASGFKLVAYAPYNTIGDLHLYQSGGVITPMGSGYIVNVNCGQSEQGQCGKKETDFWADTYDKNNSFAKYVDGTKGIYIDGSGSVVGAQDYIKYIISNDDGILNSLSLSGNFAIEMNVRVPNDTTTKHYLLNSGSNIKLFIDTDGKLYFNNIDDFRAGIELNKGNFNKIYLFKEGSKIYVSVGNYNSKVNSNQTITSTINELLVGASYSTTLGYVGQINDIIDYVKIYTK